MSRAPKGSTKSGARLEGNTLIIPVGRYNYAQRHAFEQELPLRLKGKIASAVLQGPALHCEIIPSSGRRRENNERDLARSVGAALNQIACEVDNRTANAERKEDASNGLPESTGRRSNNRQGRPRPTVKKPIVV